MGLDTTHDAWHGAYSSFGRWRNVLARAAGIPIVTDVMIGSFSHDLAEPLLDTRWTQDNYQGEWDSEAPEDPLLMLLVHSDCDGHIEAKYCEFIAVRLEQLLPKIREIDATDPPDWPWAERTEQFITGLRAAHAANERLEFF